MFMDASAFNQDLGWCVDDDVNLDYAFEDTRCECIQCESPSCGVTQSNCPKPVPTATPTIAEVSLTPSTPEPDGAERVSAAPTASDNTDAAPARPVVASLAGAVATLASLLA